MGPGSIAVVVVAVLVVAGLGAIVYVTLSVNARANLEDLVVSVSGVSDDGAAFMRAVGGVAANEPMPGNSVELYQNGDEIFPVMLDAIASARTSVHFVTFIYWAGKVPDRFADAFCAAAARGVIVRIVLDSDGSSKIPPALVARMRAAGCQIGWFRRAAWYDWASYNHRSHRRILVVDGVVGFTGGVGIADEWSGAGDRPGHWRDTHIRVRGPAVAGLQAVFVDSWNTATGELALDARLFPPLAPAGATPVCVVQSDPTRGTSIAQRTMAALIAGACESLIITNPYFIPPTPFIKALTTARARGVDVKVIMPGPYHNEPMVQRASRHVWPDLLAGGVELYEFQPTMIHAKVMVVDGRVAVVGSINFDPRSFTLNAECGLVVHDASLAQQATRAFQEDLARSRRVTQADVRRTGVLERAGDTLFYWIRAQL